MLILSQDKKRIINFDNVEVLEVVELQDCVKIQANFKNNSEIIAVYEDKELGRLQLQSICNNYKGSATYVLPGELNKAKNNRPAPTEAVMQKNY
jgi:hypothetical protein